MCVCLCVCVVMGMHVYVCVCVCVCVCICVCTFVKKYPRYTSGCSRFHFHVSSPPHGFDPPLGTFSGRGDFSLGVNMGSNSIPPKTPSDESINRGLVCAHMHFIARTQKMLTFMS